MLTLDKFEEAAKIRDKIRTINEITEKQKIDDRLGILLLLYCFIMLICSFSV